MSAEATDVTQLDIDDDWRVFDNLHTVSLTSQDGTSAVTGKYALKETISRTPMQMDEATVYVLRCRWHLFVANLGTTIPQEHGYVTDAEGTKHFIDAVDLASWDTRFVCETTARSD